MKKGIIGIVMLLILLTGSVYYFYSKSPAESTNLLDNNKEIEEEKNEEQKAFFVKQRWMHEFNMLKDPATGKIPSDIRQQEYKLARTIPDKENRIVNGPNNLNTYIEAGPNNIGGRTRAVAYDKRFNGTTNRIIIAGSISGGILRTTDAGLTWTRVSPDNDIHNLSALVQDPRAGFEDTWYAGGGEPISNSAAGAGAPYLGFGIWKSINNGQTWTKLTRDVTDIGGGTLPGGTLEGFDSPLDMVHKIAVNPLNGDVYVAGHRRLVRSTNGGTSWNVVFTGTTATSSDLGQMDIVCTNAGRLYLGVNGGLPDTDKRGLWTSTNGTTWTRIAGGSILGTDSVAGWKGNSADGDSKRIVMALAPSNQNILYVTYENGDSQRSSEGSKTEADLYKLDAAVNIWTNLSANVPDFPDQADGVDPFHVQFGYNLMIAVKPDDPNAVFLGGVNLFRSTNGFSTTTATAWIGGYGSNFPSGLNIYGSQNNGNDITKWSHPDMHALAFDPSNFNKAICANDGGLQMTDNIMATIAGVEPVSWNVILNYQTLQYYHVAMDPGFGRDNFTGGAQDNGTRFRDGSGVLTTTPALNAQHRILTGDGGAVGIAKVNGTTQDVFASTQLGSIHRLRLATGTISGSSINLRPNGATANPDGGFGDFVTYFKIDFDNPSDLYYVNFNRLFRTTSSATVTASTWTELTGVRSAVNPGNPSGGTNISITALEMSRGAYTTDHVLYIGTSNGKLFRLTDPRNALATAAPVNITPVIPALTGYISDIAVNPNNDQEVMMVVSNYGVTSVFWTTNAKSATPNWFNIEGTLTLPSFRSCMIVLTTDAGSNPVTEYYVGTSVGLYSAVNIASIAPSGSTVNVPWVREGGSVLNFAVITSMDYRPQDNVLLIGTHGNGMYFARPNPITGIPDPVRNDKNFIVKAYPTLTKDNLFYQTGNMFTVKKIIVRVHTITGQQLIRKETSYTNGSLDTRKLSKGAYILTITSDDYKQQFVQQFVKE